MEKLSTAPPRVEESRSAPSPSERSRKPSTRLRRQLPDIVSRWSFLAPTGLVLAAVLAYPIFYAVQISFSTLDLSSFSPSEWVGLQHYENALANDNFRRSLVTTGIYLALALPIQIFLGFAIAFFLNAEWWGRGLVRALFLIPLVVIPVVSGGTWKMLLDPVFGAFTWLLGLFGIPSPSWFGDPTFAMLGIVIIDTWRSTPFVVLIAAAALLSLPKDIYEAAQVDGASWWRTLWSITLPLLTPVIAAVFIVRWLSAVKMFDIVLVTTQGGPGQSTNVVNLYVYQQAFQSQRFAETAAMAIIVLIITMMLTFAFLRISRNLENRF